MATTASLLVKISADINDFSRQLNKMTKDVDRAAEKLTQVGKKLTLAISVPVALGIGELIKLSGETDRTATRMQQSFGSMASHVDQQLSKLTRIVPETTNELRAMAIQINNFATGAGFAQPKAAMLTEQVLKMSAALSERTGVDMSDVNDSLMRGLEGQTRGLKSLGIAIEKTQVAHEAYRLGLIKEHEALTPLGTALATYSLLTRQSILNNNDAANATNSYGRQLQFAWRDVKELGEKLATLLIPVFRIGVAIVRSFIETIADMPGWLLKTAMLIAVVGGALGPTITLVVNLVAAFEKLRVAIQLLMAGNALNNFLSLLKDPRVLLVMVALAALTAGAIALWKKFHKEVADTSKDMPKLDPLLDVSKLLGGITGESKFTPIQALQNEAQRIQKTFEMTVDAGGGLVGVFGRVVDLHERALGLLDAQVDKFSDMAVAAREVARQMQDIIDATKVSGALARIGRAVNVGGGTGITQQKQMTDFRSLLHTTSTGETSDTAIALGLAKKLIQDETALRTREAAIRLPDAFDGVRVGTLEFKENLRTTSEELAKTRQQLKLQFSDWSSIKSSVGQALETTALDFAKGFTPAALAAQLLSKALESIAVPIEAFLKPVMALAGAIGQSLIPILHTLFPVIKLVGIVLTILGEVMARVSSAIARAVGNLIIGLGKVLSKIPGLHGLGRGLQNAGRSMLTFADEQSKAAKAFHDTRTELEKMTWDSAVAGVNALGSAANAASEALYNVPDGWKIALARFNATMPDDGGSTGGGTRGGGGSGSGSYGGSGGGGGDGGGNGGTGFSPNRLAGGATMAPVVVQIDGKKLARIVWGHLQSASQSQFGTPTRVAEVTF